MVIGSEKLTVFLGMGGNRQGTADALKQTAAKLLTKFGGSVIFSSVFKTRSFQNNQQPDYLNCCVRFTVSPDTPPLSILEFCLQTEQELGRLRTGKRWDNRLIDIDILLIGQQIHQLPELTVPHYQLHLRDFFLIPLAEIACDTSIPPEGLTPVQLLRRIPKEYLTSPEPTGITLP